MSNEVLFHKGFEFNAIKKLTLSCFKILIYLQEFSSFLVIPIKVVAFHSLY